MDVFLLKSFAGKLDTCIPYFPLPLLWCAAASHGDALSRTLASSTLSATGNSFAEDLDGTMAASALSTTMNTTMSPASTRKTLRVTFGDAARAVMPAADAGGDASGSRPHTSAGLTFAGTARSLLKAQKWAQVGAGTPKGSCTIRC